MNKIHQQRIITLIFFIVGLALATALILYALSQNINVFLTPKDLVNVSENNNHRLRLGGMVKPGSLVRATDTLAGHFILTDTHREIMVNYTGILPDLFREGQGAVAEGYFHPPNTFEAKQILAKHDENYMPKEVYQALRERS